MAARIVDSLKWIIGADSTEFRREFARARKSVESDMKGISASVDGVASNFRTLRNVVLGVLGAGTFGAFAKDVINTVAGMNDMTQATGMSVQELSTWRFALDQTGTSLSTFQRGATNLSKQIDKIAKDADKGRTVFDDLGIAVVDSAGNLRKTSDIVLDVAEVFSRMEDGATKTAIASEIFGHAVGPELIPFLNKGRDGIQDMTDRARELGLELSIGGVQAADDFKNLLADTVFEMRGFAEAIAIDMLPGMAEWIRTVRFAREESGNLAAAWVALGGIGSALFTETDAERVRDLQRRIEETTALIQETERKAGEDRGILGRIFGADYEERAERLRAILAEYRAELEALLPAVEEDNKRREENAKRMQQEREEAARRRREFAEQLQRQREQASLDEKNRKEAERRAEQAETVVKNLEKERALLGITSREEQVQIEIALGMYDHLNSAQRERLVQLAREIDLQNALTEELKKSQKEQEEYEKKMKSLAERVIESTKTEVELLYEEIDKLDKLLDEGYITWEVYVKAMENADKKMKDLTKETGLTIEEFSKRAAENAQDAFADFLFDPFDDGLRGMVSSFTDAIRRILAEALAAQALQAVLPTSFFGAADGGVARFAAGGRVSGPGTTTSDSVPARLSRDEFVQPAKSAHYYGMDFMEALRRRAIPRSAVRPLLGDLAGISPRVPPISRFAEGGRASPEAQGGGMGNVRIVNIVDKDLVEEFLNSPEGDKVIVNKIRRNSLAVRGVL